jgi:cyclopropane-fatty-acyl-phospholipid synthase
LNTRTQALLPDSGRRIDESGSRVTRWARSAVLGRLATLGTARLRIVDAWGETLVGRGEASPIGVTVGDLRFYTRVLLGGSLGAAESWMDGEWTCSDPTGLIAALVRDIELVDGMDGGWSTLANARAWLADLARRNSQRGARRNIHAHYDLGNDFFELFLDETLTYSAGIFETPGTTLADASRAKLERICRKLGLCPRHRVVEIGSGWGSFALHAATHHGCHVTTTTISREQHARVSELVRERGLGDRITVLLADYRDLRGTFDRLVSIEMIEAVGHDFLPTYFAACSRLLAEDGEGLIQAITMPDRRYERYRRESDFIRRYVFPGSCVPSLGAINDALRRASDLALVHLEDIGPHYARTLRCWSERFEHNLDAVRALGFDERFVRLWRYYLAYCEAGFAERYIGVAQLLLRKPGARSAAVLGALDFTTGSVAS